DGVTHVLEIPDDGEDHIFVLSAMKSKGNVFLSILAGLGVGLLSVLVVIFMLYAGS
ncbi:MAG: hypothetical protein GY771_10395, partial [bacterium]|nr:hypothetical protein [bacterium]